MTSTMTSITSASSFSWKHESDYHGPPPPPPAPFQPMPY